MAASSKANSSVQDSENAMRIIKTFSYYVDVKPIAKIVSKLSSASPLPACFASPRLLHFTSPRKRGEGVPNAGGHELRQSLPLFPGQQQAELAAAPEHIVRALRPFVRHQVTHLRPVEVGAEVRPEILDRLGRSQDAGDAGPVGAHEAPRVTLAQEWPGPPGLGNEPLDAVEGEVAARQRRVPGPCGA